jgi:lactate permease
MVDKISILTTACIQTCAAVVLGFHEALTPITIMAGASTLFETMEATLCLPYMMRELKALTAGHPIADLMLLFCFATVIEGASGFGTPVALVAPMLVSTGNPPFESVVTLFLFNAFVTCWGAVGTPIWFGFGDLELSEADSIDISTKAGVALGISAFCLIPLVLTVIVPLRLVRQNILFVFLSLCCCIGCIMGIAVIDYQFPTLIGGLVQQYSLSLRLD